MEIEFSLRGPSLIRAPKCARRGLSRLSSGVVVLLSSLAILTSLALCASGCASDQDPNLSRDREQTSDEGKMGSARAALGGAFSVTSGVWGRVTTLASYSGGGVHPGVNSVDLGAPGFAAVWHQLDYLPPTIAGGWVRTYASREAGLCSQWFPGSPYYNGAKLLVFTYFYGTDGAYLGWHRAAYQHVEPGAWVGDGWWRWNNVHAPIESRAWGPSADVELGGGEQNGLYLGEVFNVTRPIRNGPSGHLCTDGSHLHQEAMGWRAGSLYVGKYVVERYSDIQLFNIAGGWPPIWGPPSDPTFEQPAPPPPPPSEAPPSDPEPVNPDPIPTPDPAPDPNPPR